MRRLQLIPASAFSGKDVVKTLFLVVVLVLLLSPGCLVCNLAPGASIDREEARKVSDSFMADLVNDKVAEAVELMEPAFVNSLQPKEAETNIRKLFEYCGRPTEYTLNHDEMGMRMNFDGRTMPMRKFFYDGATTANPRGVCLFSVEVVPGDNDLRVASFGPLKRLSPKAQ